MPTDTTPSGEPETPQEDWASRYQGLQKVVAKRDADLASRQAALDALKAEHEAATLELSEYRQKAVDTSEEDAARQQYEQLAERFAPAPTPIGNTPERDPWIAPRYADREREATDEQMHWPT